jgi:hypothetical protein
MKYSTALIAAAAIIPAASAAGSCKYIDSFGADLCEHGNNDSWLPEWIEETTDQSTCTGLTSSIGCTWSGSSCSQATTNCAGQDEEGCSALFGKSCYWEETGRCDPHDAMKCTADGTGFHTCSHKAWENLVDAIINKVDIWDPSTWNIEQIVTDFGNRMKNGCVNDYLQCFYTTECGSPELVITGICEDTMEKVCEELGIAQQDCPAEWCSMGVTQGSSLIDIALEFADDVDLDAFFDAAKIDELKETIELIAGGGLNFDWIDFDTATGKISITIPDNTIISQAQFDAIVQMLEDMLSGNSGSAMTGGFAVKSASVTAPASITIDSSQAAWEGKKAEGGMGLGAIVGIALACAGVVGGVVGTIVYSRRSGGAPKQHGGVAMSKGKGKRGSANAFKGNVNNLV